MSFQECTDMSEAAPLDVSLGLYLKPASKIKISVQIPKLKTSLQSISSWQVMEKLKAMVRPDQFLFLKALKITSTVIKFLGELETRPAADRALARLQTTGSIKLPGFSELLQIRSAHAASSGPTRHDWDSFFRDARGVDEMKPGERPDTLFLEEVPISWFSESTKNLKPSERLIQKAFSSFGRIRRIEIPVHESLKDKTFGKTSSLYQDSTFQVYIQYKEYVEFATAMDSLRGKKLVYKDGTEGKTYTAEIKVDFDRTNYLSDKNIKKRELEVQKLSTSVLCSDRKKETEIANKAKEAKHELPLCSTIHSKEVETEAYFLLKELLKKAEIAEQEKDPNPHKNVDVAADLTSEAKKKETVQMEKNQEKLLIQEQILKEKLLRSLKEKEQRKIARVREKIRKELGGRKLLSVLSNSNNPNSKKLKTS